MHRQLEQIQDKSMTAMSKDHRECSTNFYMYIQGKRVSRDSILEEILDFHRKGSPFHLGGRYKHVPSMSWLKEVQSHTQQK